MSDKNWIKVSIFTSPEGIEPLFGMLYSMGINGAEIVDEGDFQNFLENNKQYWDYVDDEVLKEKHCPTHLNVFIRDDIYGREQISLLNENLAALKRSDIGIDMGPPLTTKMLDIDEDMWFEKWKQYFKPIEIGEKIIVIPEWEKNTNKERLPLIINPGQLFGTGGHHTTRMCMEILESTVKGGEQVLDLGCGSGILSILSLILGAAGATAVDIDHSAIKTAYENASLNSIGKDKYRVLSGNILSSDELIETISDKKYDIVVANIVADVIIDLALVVRKYMKDDGIFICSGIIEHRYEDVYKALCENGFEIIEKRNLGEWVAAVTK